MQLVMTLKIQKMPRPDVLKTFLRQSTDTGGSLHKHKFLYRKPHTINHYMFFLKKQTKNPHIFNHLLLATHHTVHLQSPSECFYIL